ncbi:MAG: PQQ-like beta-propeller repeat protein [Phycisphaerales bacterium]|nr:PQQ-like beta-propeller repeat protein [Phycisphaerales bacterium]
MKQLFLSALTLLTTSSLAVAEANFSHFRGDNHDGIAVNESNLLRAWPKEGLKELWRTELGGGYGSGVIHDEKVYVLDYEKVKNKGHDLVRAFDLDTGNELWRCSYDGLSANKGSRANPTVNENHVVSLGSGGIVSCIERKTGKLAWTIDLVKGYGLKIHMHEGNRLSAYGVAQSPLIDDDSVVIATGTPKALMIKVELATGKILWSLDNPKQWTMSHTSITPFTFHGQKQYVYSSFHGIVSVSADGKILWEYPEWRARVQYEKEPPEHSVHLSLIPSPVVIGEDKLFFCAQHKNNGSMMLQLTQAENGNIETKQLFHVPRMGSIIPTPIYFNGRLFGSETGKAFTCMSLDGKMIWNQKGLGQWPFLIADSMIYILDQHAKLYLLDATALEYKELAAWQIPFEGRKYYDAASWSPMTMSNGRLILRLGDELVCLLVK